MSEFPFLSTPKPIVLRKDTVSGVLFNAADPAQAAAHPSSKSPTTGATSTIPVKDAAIKLATPIAAKLARDMNNPKKPRSY